LGKNVAIFLNKMSELQGFGQGSPYFVPAFIPFPHCGIFLSEMMMRVKARRGSGPAPFRDPR
jgi:hypothetical protein